MLEGFMKRYHSSHFAPGMRPLRGDWISRVEDELLARDLAQNRGAFLVAHSLGCMTAVAWASHSQNTERVGAVLLVSIVELCCGGVDGVVLIG